MRRQVGRPGKITPNDSDLRMPRVVGLAQVRGLAHPQIFFFLLGDENQPASWHCSVVAFLEYFLAKASRLKPFGKACSAAPCALLPPGAIGTPASPPAD